MSKKKQKKQDPKVSPSAPRRSYAGAKNSRLLSDWSFSNASGDNAIFSSLKTLRSRSRSLERDNDYVCGLFTTLQDNIVGAGVVLQAKVKKQRGKKPDLELNQKIETVWARWSRAENCHVGGRMSWTVIQQLIIRAIVQDGEVFVRIVRQPFGTSKIPLALEVIEADQLAEDHTVRELPNGHTIKMGIEFNEWQRPVAYWMLPYHPGELGFVMRPQKTKPERILAHEIIHLYRILRPSQTRGVPWIYSSMVRMNHVGRYEEAEVIATRAQANIMGFVERTDDDPVAPDPNNQPDSQDQIDGFEPGAIDYLNPGETFKGFAPTRPGDAFDPFMKAMLRALSAGQGVSYESVSKNYSDTNYSSARAAFLPERLHYRILQNWLIEALHTPIYELWIEAAILCGEISIPNFEFNFENYVRHRWMAPGWKWVDPLKDGMANVEALRSGLTTATKILAEEGEDYEEILIQRKEEIELAKSMGLEFDLTGKGPPQDTQLPADSNPPAKKFLEMAREQYLITAN
jgi:lambda family phage portal protein